MPDVSEDLFPHMQEINEKGYVIPFGDGPNPLFTRRVYERNRKIDLRVDRNPHI